MNKLVLCDLLLSNIDILVYFIIIMSQYQPKKLLIANLNFLNDIYIISNALSEYIIPWFA